MEIELILWDNDGVLVDTEILYYEANKAVLGEAGIELTEDLFARYWLTQSEGIEKCADDYGLDSGQVPILRARRNKRYSKLLRSRSVLIEGVAAVLEVLRPHYRMGVVTSSRRDHFEVIHQKTGILPYFEFALQSGDYARSKPAPDPYLKALEVAAVPKERALVIEDSVRGLIAAKAAELKCWVIPRGLSLKGDFAAADRVLPSISEIPALLGVCGNSEHY